MASIYLWCTVLLVLLPSNLIWAEQNVVIIGGGLAGLTVARKLVNEGKWNVTVLEANDQRYGGRIWTNKAAMPIAKGKYFQIGLL